MNPVTDIDHSTDAQLHDELIKPAYKFKGETLWPWSRVTRHLYDMLIREGIDLNVFRWLLVVWLLKKRGGKDAEEDAGKVLPICYHAQDMVRAEIIFGRSKLTNADEDEAEAIYNAVMKAEADSAVVVAPRPGQKKIEAIAPPIGDGSSISSVNADVIEAGYSSIPPS